MAVGARSTVTRHSHSAAVDAAAGMSRRPDGGGQPRRIGGGRSARYDSRRAERGVTGQYAAEWSDAAALAVHEGLHTGRLEAGAGIGAHVTSVLRCDDGPCSKAPKPS